MSWKITYYPAGKRGTRSEKRILLTGRRAITVGRDPTADIVLDDSRVSRFHARIEVDGDRLVISDLDSKNGTAVNNERIARAVWHSGQQITVGGYVLELAEPKPVRLAGTFRPLRDRARITVIFLLFSALLVLVSLFFDIWHAFYLATSNFKYSSWLYLGLDNYPHLGTMQVLMTISSLASLFIYLAIAIAFLMWLHRAVGNLEALAIADLSFTPNTAVLWWLLPFGGFVLVWILSTVLPAWLTALAFVAVIVFSMVAYIQILRSLSEVWRASIPRITGAAWRGLPTPPVVIAWWVTYFVIPLVIVMLATLLPAGIDFANRSAALDLLQANIPFAVAVIFVLIGRLALLASILLAIKIVNRVTDNQERTYRQVAPEATMLV
ncbi:MAG: FHA domain-containing protein [Hyphomicrobiaceae bacterium]|nr:FHA domain-containing protein [Hyphomicrobiaceae bacterium]